GDVDVGDAVAVREHELSITEVLPHAEQALARQAVEAGVGERDLEVVAALLVVLDPGRAGVEREVARVGALVQEELLDDLSLVAERQHELAVTVVGVELHDVPQDRLVADVHHGLGLELGLLFEPGALAAAQDDGLHATFPSSRWTCSASASDA